ncbi:hypothetical protein ACFLYO_10450 [Chloroflexota bacterium]
MNAKTNMNMGKWTQKRFEVVWRFLTTKDTFSWQYLHARLPLLIALVLLVLTTSMWTFWSVGELFYEGWWGPWYYRAPYLIPGAVCLLITFFVLTWPRIFGWITIILSGVFTAWWLSMLSSRVGGLSLLAILSLLPMSGMLILVGALLLLEARRQRQRQRTCWVPPRHPLRRYWRYVIGIGIPLVIALVMVIFNIWLHTLRVNDGYQGERLIEGNGVRLIWAPSGPGWATGPDWQGINDGTVPEFPSWNHIALYGLAPVGFEDKLILEDRQFASGEEFAEYNLCRYLSADGFSLLDEQQNIWRLPTANEVVRSLIWRGENAGCTWDGISPKSTCASPFTHKDTPLWDLDRSAVYYWVADEYNRQEAYYVSCTGYVNHQPKNWGNSRHGFRCVRYPTQ